MSTPLYPAWRANQLVQIQHRIDATERLFWADAFVVWRLTRPDPTWDDGSEEERWHPVELPDGVPSVGRLADGGSGGMGDEDLGGVIVNLTPYRFRCDKRVPITDDDLLAINGKRVFLVRSVVRTDQEAASMWVYLTERSGDEIPEEVTP